MGVALFWLLPEMQGFLGWPAAISWVGAGVVALAVIDRYVYPVCPACAPAHDHAHCETRLHGFALPLLAAAALHSALAGRDHPVLGPALLLGIAAHKVPEGLALGVIARASLAARWSALGWCVTAQAATLAGAVMELAFSPYLGTRGLYALLALAGGSFLYLGWHAIHGELRRSGPAPAFLPALTGMAGSTVLRLFVR